MAYQSFEHDWAVLPKEPIVKILKDAGIKKIRDSGKETARVMSTEFVCMILNNLSYYQKNIKTGKLGDIVEKEEKSKYVLYWSIYDENILLTLINIDVLSHISHLGNTSDFIFIQTSEKNKQHISNIYSEFWKSYPFTSHKKCAPWKDYYN